MITQEYDTQCLHYAVAVPNPTGPAPPLPLPLPLSPGYTFCAAPGTQNGIVGQAINVGGLPRNDSESGERPPTTKKRQMVARWCRAKTQSPSVTGFWN